LRRRELAILSDREKKRQNGCVRSLSDDWPPLFALPLFRTRSRARAECIFFVSAEWKRGRLMKAVRARVESRRNGHSADSWRVREIFPAKDPTSTKLPGDSLAESRGERNYVARISFDLRFRGWR